MIKIRAIDTSTMFLAEKHIQTYEGRCGRCFMRSTHCICNDIPNINNEIPLTIVMHVRETYKTTNTGRIAHMSLKNSRVLLRGDKEQPLKSEDHFPNGPTYLCLTLTDDSVELTPEFISSLKKPIHLVVPDGNWRQANKMANREPALKQMLKVKLPVGQPSRYQLRREHHVEGLATIEAIARAYGIIENQNVQADLEVIFLTMVEKTMQTRAPINK